MWYNILMSTARDEGDNIEFLADIVLPDEGCEKGVYITAGNAPREFFVAHNEVSRNLRVKKFASADESFIGEVGLRIREEKAGARKVKIKIDRVAHQTSSHLLDLPSLIRKAKLKVSAAEGKKDIFPAGDFVLSQIKKPQKVERELNSARRLASQELPSRHVSFSRASWRGALAFAIFCLIFVLPIKAFTYYGAIVETKKRIVAAGLAGLEHFEEGGGAIARADFAAASAAFENASVNFETAKNILGQAGGNAGRILSALPYAGRFYSFGRDLALLGENLSLAGLDLSRGIAALTSGYNWLSRLDSFGGYLSAAIPRLAVAENLLGSLRANLEPPLTLDKWELLNEAVVSAKSGLAKARDASGFLTELLGKDAKKRYLLVFQNSNELRPTGGFMGSFAFLDIRAGEIKNLEIPGGGTYDLQGQLRELRLPPEPMRLIASSWQLRDANWWPDFPASAKKIMWFYEKSGGSSLDGVIAINSTLAARLLNLTGPIPMPEYGKLVTAENFIDELQQYVEVEYDKKENRPKQIIADLAPKLIERLRNMTADDLPAVLDLLSGAVSAKDIQMYFADEKMEKAASGLGIAGAIMPCGEGTDYLAVVNTNIAGQKTDGVIREIIDETIDVSPEGTIDKTLKITRVHDGVRGASFSGVRNVNYLRVYVPEGSILLSAEGFTAPSAELFKAPETGAKDDEDLAAIQTEYFIDPTTGTYVGGEFGKTVFGNWVMVDPGNSVTETFRYRLPFKFAPETEKDLLQKIYDKVGRTTRLVSYGEIVQKQSGAANTRFVSHLNLPKDYLFVSRYPSGLNFKSSGWEIAEDLNSDKFFGIVLKDTQAY